MFSISEVFDPAGTVVPAVLSLFVSLALVFEGG